MATRWKKVWIIRRQFKRNHSYQVVYHDPRRGRRKYDRSFRTERLAKEYSRKLELHLNGAGPHPEITPTATFSQEPDECDNRPWVDTVKEWIDGSPTRPRTQAWYSLVLNRFATVMGVDAIGDVSERVISSFLAGLRAEGRADATTAAYLRVLAAFLRAVCGETQPVTRELISRWKPYRDRKCARPHLYTDDEYRRILHACDSVRVRQSNNRGPLWWKTYITILHDCGLRLNEVAHLIWYDIDFAAGELRVAPHVKLKGVFGWQPKGKTLRTLPISPELLKLLAEMQAIQEEGVPYVFVPISRYLDLVRRGLPPSGFLLHSIRQGFIRIRTRAGIPEGTIHDMRRTFVTNWLRRPGMSPEEVQLLAGHEDIQTTLKIYAQVSAADVVSKAKRLLQNSNDNASSSAATVDVS